MKNENLENSLSYVAIRFAEKKSRGRCPGVGGRSRPIAHDAENRTKIAENLPDTDDATPSFSRKIDFYNSETT